MNSLSKRTRKNFFAVSNLKLIFMTNNNFPTNLKEMNSNRLNRRSLIGHHRMANLLRLISLLKNAAWTSKNSISTKASNFQIFLKKNGLPTKTLKLGTTCHQTSRQRQCRSRLAHRPLQTRSFQTISRH